MSFILKTISNASAMLERYRNAAVEINDPGSVALVSLNVAIILHDELIRDFGGAPGIRDASALESALSRPGNLLSYGEGHIDLARLSASLAKGLAQNHAFVDGNKRTAWFVARSFLLANGVDVVADEDVVVENMVKLADHSMSEEQFSGWLKTVSHPTEQKAKSISADLLKIGHASRKPPAPR